MKPKYIFFTAILFLLIRNTPLCILMPLWAFGDELGHVDYVFKISRGHIPQPEEYIESSLYLLHRVQTKTFQTPPQRSLSTRRMNDLPLLGHSYEAHHPPLAYFILSIFQRGFHLFGLPIIWQIRLLRIACCLAIVAGISFLFLIFQKLKFSLEYHISLLFIALLSQDMYFSVNTDAFSFLFGSMAIGAALLVVRNPDARPGWTLLSASIVLSLWVKATNLYLLLLWAILCWIFVRENRSQVKKIWIFALGTLLFSSLWYFYNYWRFSNFFVSRDLPFPPRPPRYFSLASIQYFFTSFLNTLFRGGLFWKGKWFEAFSRLFNVFLLNVVPGVVFVAGFLSYKKILKKRDRAADQIVLSLGIWAWLGLFLGFALVGGVAYNGARFAFGILFPLMFLYAYGWKMVIPWKRVALIIPSSILFVYNLIYSLKLLWQITQR
jgi:hypothetical protein